MTDGDLSFWKNHVEERWGSHFLGAVGIISGRDSRDQGGSERDIFFGISRHILLFRLRRTTQY